MKRRALLVGIGASVTSGCISSAATDDSRQSMTAPRHKLSVERTRVRPDRGVSLTGEVNQQATPHSPPEVTIALTNDRDSSRSIVTGPSPPFDPSVADQANGDAALFVVPPRRDVSDPSDDVGAIETRPGSRAEDVIPKEPTDGCWAATEPAVPAYPMARGTTLQPGASIEGTYVLLADPRNNHCVPAGTYEATDTVEVDDELTELAITLRVQTGR